MNTEPSAPAGEEAISVVSAPDSAPQTTSVSEAARLLRSIRKPPEPVAAQEQPAAPVEQSADEADATPQIEATGETQEAAPAETPPRELPRSWTKEQSEHWSKLDPALQEFLLEQDSKASAATRRSLNEAAEQRKLADAEKAAASEARQKYEQSLPALLQTLQQAQSGEFSDIKTMADVENLARTDWPRYILFDAQQKKLAFVQKEMADAREREVQEFSKQWTDFAKREDDLFSEKAPEMRDKAKAEKLQRAAVDTLKDIGFADQELADAWNGKLSISVRDHRFQMLVRDAVLYRDAQTARKAVIAKPLPAPVRPGTAQPKGAVHDATLQSLTQRLEKTGSAKDAARLLMERRKAG